MNYILNKKIIFSINDNVNNKFLDIINNYDYSIESGGIIVGTLEPNNNRVVATDITEPQEGDSCLRYRFNRTQIGHQEIMDNLWEQSKNTKSYIGEWHTHNQSIPQPSNIDFNNWLKISNRKHNSDWLFFIIVGTEQIGVWTISNEKIVKMISYNC